MPQAPALDSLSNLLGPSSPHYLFPIFRLLLSASYSLHENLKAKCQGAKAPQS